MNVRFLAAVLVLAAIGAVVWRAQLFTVEKSGATPRPLVLLPEPRASHPGFDVTLPAVPVGTQRLHPGAGVLLVHYWAPWERHSGAQARGLDSLRRELPPGALTLAVVCFDPYPSVSRYAARLRLRLPLLLDIRHELADHLACPSIPYTYVIDASGRVAVAQEGEVDWLSPVTRATLTRLFDEPAAPAVVPRTGT